MRSFLRLLPRLPFGFSQQQLQQSVRQFRRAARKRNPPLPPGIKYTKAASGTAATAALAMATYVSAVQKPSRISDVDEKPDAHHVKDRSGKVKSYKNPYPSFDPFRLPEVLYAFFYQRYVTGDIAFPKPKKEDKIVSVIKPEFLGARTGESSSLRATWLGHACYYVEFPSGLRVLFDPVFEDQCAPVDFLGMGRYTEPPCTLGELPVVDAVIISHSHYDHLSHPSVLEIKKHHPNAHFFVGMGLEKWFKKSGVENVTEMDWWQEAEMTLTVQRKSDAAGGEPEKPITAIISCLPCQHGSGRTLTDKDTTLWCSWAVKSGSPAKSVWFGGDTGYRTVPRVGKGEDDYGEKYADLPHCPQFKAIGEKFGGFDLGMIPIGAYAPRNLMSCVHANPYDAVEIFRDTGCRRAMGIHWGTWVLTCEEVLEPPKLLREALAKRGLPETGVFDICDIGETREF